MTASLDIIIVNWNAGGQLRDSLESINNAANRDDFELSRVVVVDNASTDCSANGLKDLRLPLTIIRNKENRGFAAACNQGAKGSIADYLLFLNPDTRLFADSLWRPISFMEEPGHEYIGICGVKVQEKSGRMTTSCARFPTLRLMFGKMTGLYRLFPKLFPRHFLAESECTHSMEVDQVIGAFFLVRKSVFDALHGFDERFFVYFEEVDFSLRAKQKGFASYYLCDVSIFHRGGGITENVKSIRLFYSLRSGIIYGFKNFRYLHAIALALLTLSVELMARIIRSAISFSFSQFLETIGGYKRLFIYFIGRVFKWK